MSSGGHGPKSARMVGNGFRMVARSCQGSPEVPVDLEPGLQTALGPGEAARGQFQPKLTIRATSTVGGSNRRPPALGLQSRPNTPTGAGWGYCNFPCPLCSEGFCSVLKHVAHGCSLAVRASCRLLAWDPDSQEHTHCPWWGVCVYV